MKGLVLFLFMLCVAYGMGFIRYEKKGSYDYMSFEHTNSCRAVAALIIMLQHVAGKFGFRIFTPLGGIGVAIFLILSGYGLNESYKRKKTGGGKKILEKQGA